MPSKYRYTSFLKYSFFTSSILNRVLVDIIGTFIMMVLELILIFQIKSFYLDDKTIFTLHESFAYAPIMTFTFFIIRIGFFIFLLCQNSIFYQSGMNRTIIVLNNILIIYFAYMILINPFNTNVQFRKESLWWHVNIQMLGIIMLTFKVGYLILSLQYSGVLMRMFLKMFIIVVAFTAFSFLPIFFLAFSVHCLFMSYTSDANVFDSLYYGILFLYEFTFGSVGYIRDEGLHTNSFLLNVFLIFFSFFGNIMLVNMLIVV